MQALPSHVDTRSETYRTNREGDKEVSNRAAGSDQQGVWAPLRA